MFIKITGFSFLRTARENQRNEPNTFPGRKEVQNRCKLPPCIMVLAQVLKTLLHHAWTSGCCARSGRKQHIDANVQHALLLVQCCRYCCNMHAFQNGLEVKGLQGSVNFRV